jgi:hypothetical protein
MKYAPSDPDEARWREPELAEKFGIRIRIAPSDATDR